MTPAQNKIKKYREDPITMVRKEFNVEPDAWQKRGLIAFASKDPKDRRISFQACAGPGKTAELAWMGWNFLLCYGEPDKHPLAAALSITETNLRDNLWKEMAVWQARSKLLSGAFTWTKERIFAKDHPQTWWMSARSVSQKANPDEKGRTLSGLHAKYILYLIDESGDQEVGVLRSAEQGMGNCVWGKIIQAGNTTSQAGMLYAAATIQRHLWNVIAITGDPDDPQRSPRVDIEWAREQIRLYGRTNPWVMAYVLGQFPNTAINALLSLEEVQAAMARHYTKDQYEYSQKRLGIDAARFGDDPWVIFPRQGLVSFMPATMRGPRTQEVAARIASAKAKWGSELELFDDTGGWAGGAIDACILAGMSPIPINFSSRKTDDPRYYNKRAEIWFKMAEWIKRGGALPKLDEIIAELTIPKYWFEGGRFRLEEKEQIKKRLGRSPNYADALALTFGITDMPATSPYSHLIQKQELKSDYDPFAERTSTLASDFDPFR